MTDRHRGYIVTLERDTREDDAEAILNALRMVKGVLSVEPLVSDMAMHMAEQRAKADLSDKLWRVLHPDME